jgi:hypothetical protein
MLPASDRQAYLSEACADNDALRQEVESLLASDERAQSFLECPAVPWGDGTPHTAQFTIEGRRLGAYQVQAPLGAGGMGQVYCAHDTELQRNVALKLLPDAFASDPDRLARLTREAQTLAALNHPNIAAIYGIEKSDGIRALVSAENCACERPRHIATCYARQRRIGGDPLREGHFDGITAGLRLRAHASDARWRGWRQGLAAARRGKDAKADKRVSHGITPFNR